MPFYGPPSPGILPPILEKLMIDIYNCPRVSEIKLERWYCLQYIKFHFDYKHAGDKELVIVIDGEDALFKAMSIKP